MKDVMVRNWRNVMGSELREFVRIRLWRCTVDFGRVKEVNRERRSFD